MTNVAKKDETFKEILSKFVKIVYISDDELNRMHSYVFSQSGTRELNDDSSIYETLVYLRDLCEESGYTSVEELSLYFNKQKADIDELIEPFVHNADDDFSETRILRFFHHSFKTKIVRLLASHRLPQLQPSLADAANEYDFSSYDNQIMELEKSYKSFDILSDCFKRINIFYTHSNKVLPNSDYLHFKYYFESFSKTDKKASRFIYMMKRLKGWFSFLFVDNFWHLKSIMNRKKKHHARIEVLYQKIYQSLHAEQPINDKSLKTMICRFMLLAKMNNPKFRASKKDNMSTFILKRMYYKEFSEKKWAILKSPLGHTWMTSDNPGFSVDFENWKTTGGAISPDAYWNQINGNSVIYFPLSTEYCLRLLPASDRKTLADKNEQDKIFFEDSSEKELKVVNKLILSSKPEVIISKDKGIRLHHQDCI